MPSAASRLGTHTHTLASWLGSGYHENLLTSLGAIHSGAHTNRRECVRVDQRWSNNNNISYSFSSLKSAASVSAARRRRRRRRSETLFALPASRSADSQGDIQCPSANEREACKRPARCSGIQPTLSLLAEFACTQTHLRLQCNELPYLVAAADLTQSNWRSSFCERRRRGKIIAQNSRVASNSQISATCYSCTN